MAGRFSVTNLFGEIQKQIAANLAPLVGMIWNRIKDYLIPITKILVLVKQFYDTFKSEIKWLAREIERILRVLAKGLDSLRIYIERTIRNYINQIQKRLNKIPSDIDKGTKALLKPVQKEITGRISDTRKLIDKAGRTVDTVNKNVTKTGKDILALPGKVAKDTGAALSKEMPKAIKGSQRVIVEVIDSAVRVNPYLKVMKEAGDATITVIKPIAKNPSNLTKIISKAPSVLDDVGKVLGLFVRGTKTVTKGIPIIGGFLEAMDWEYFKNEFEISKRDQAKMWSDVKWTQDNTRNLQQGLNNARTEIRRLESKIDRLLGISPNSGSIGNSGGVTQAQINSIINGVSRAVENSNNSQTSQLTRAINSATSGPNGANGAIDYNRISQLMNNAVASNSTVTATKQDIQGLNTTINSLRTLIPSESNLVRQINAHTTATAQAPQQIDLRPVEAQLRAVNQSITGVNSTVQATQTAINNLPRAISLNTVTPNDLRASQIAIVNEIKSLPRTPNPTNYATTADINALFNRINSIDYNPVIRVNSPSVTVNPTPVTVNVPESVRPDYARIKADTTQVVQTELAKLPSPTADPKAAEAADFSKKTFDLLGGNALLNGIPTNTMENQITNAGTQQYNGDNPIVKSIPELLTAVAAPAFMRAGLHRLPATLPSSVSNPNAAPTVISDNVALQKHYHSLIDERIGAPVPIKIKSIDGEITTIAARNINEGLDTITAQNIQQAEELAVVQQAVMKLAADQAAMGQILLVDHDILESLRDFCGYRYEETKRTKPLEFGLGKESLLDFLNPSNLNYVGSKFAGKTDLTEMLQKLYLETGKISASTFTRFDPADPNAKLPMERTSNGNKNEDDDEWLKFVKLVNENPSALRTDIDVQAVIKRYTNNDVKPIDTTAVQLPQG